MTFWKININFYFRASLFYRRYIDDVICLWTSPDNNTSLANDTYQKLQEDMNNFGKLRWEFEPLSHSTTFLDLNIKLENTYSIHASNTDYTENRAISFSTYQKVHNLYLYLPPHSAHPPGTTRSLIHGLMRKYWLQNTKTTDFHTMTKLLFNRLLARGHSADSLYSLFLQAATSIDKKHTDKNQHSKHKDKNSNEIFLKWKYHPQDISRKQMQHSYHKTCELRSFSAPQGFKKLHTDHGSTMTIDKLTIAYTRDQNLRDLLIPSRLPNLPDYTVSTLLKNFNEKNK